MDAARLHGSTNTEASHTGTKSVSATYQIAKMRREETSLAL